MTNFMDLAKKRYSVRKYADQPIEKEKLDYILECGRIAPSAANLQPWRIYVVSDPVMRKKICETYAREWLQQAPVILVFCGDHSKAWKRGDGKDHTDIDISIIIDHITLAAAEQDLGTCWICNFNARKCGEILDLPKDLEPIALLPIGYPDDADVDLTRHLKRKALDEIAVFI